MRVRTGQAVTTERGFSGQIGIVVSRYNETLSEGLYQGAIKVLSDAGLRQDQVSIYRVPGAFEIPLMARTLADKGCFDGLICLGVVIKGETPHFEYICEAAAMGIQRVNLDYGIPTSFGIITALNVEQAQKRALDDDYNKGREAALTTLEMIALVGPIKAKGKLADNRFF